MWKYIRKYLRFGIPAAVFMVGEVSLELLQPTLMSRIVDEGVLGRNNGGVGDMQIILSTGLMMIILTVLSGSSGSLNNVFAHLFGQNVGNDLRKDSFRKIMNMSFQQVDHYSTGSLITRVTNDITQVQNFVSLFIRGMIRTLLLTFGSIYCMFRLNVTFGWMVVAAFPLLFAVIAWGLCKISPLFTRLQTQLDEINAIMQEDISGIRMIKSFVQEMHEKDRFEAANLSLIRTQLRSLILLAFINPTTNLVMYAVITCILFVGAGKASVGAMTAGTLIAAISYTTTLLNGIMMMVMIFQNITRGIASWTRVREILSCEPELADGTAKTEAGMKEPNGLRGEIRMEHVSFAYPGSRKTVLREINLNIHPGEKVAIMGSTGCGKSTLLSLIPRFYDVSEGAVFVDGTDVRDYVKTDLRERISFVLQKAELFSKTIGENIRFGRTDAGPEEIQAAAGISQAVEFIETKSEGYDTPVAEGGHSLSGGQKQRLSIARAVVKNADIYIFDDATSALDLKTEAELYKALDEAKPGCTMVFVAQRIVSARHADRIVVMDKCTILASGTHAELLKTCPVYREICLSQSGAEENPRGGTSNA